MELSNLKKELKAHAKVNLFLAVGKTDERNYHLLNTVFQPLDLSDKIILEERMNKGIVLKSNWNIPLGEKNSVHKAICFMCQKAKKSIANVKLNVFIHKNIPLSSGLGGSAVDAAPVIRELNSKWKVGLTNKEMEEVASMVGADVPQALYNNATYAEGYGDKILSHYSLPKRYVCIYVPKEYMSEHQAKTAALYKMIDEERNEKRNEIVRIKKYLMIKALELKNWHEIGKFMHNDFEFVAFKKYPSLRRIKELFLENGAHGALLAGSGGAVFGIFETPKLALKASNIVCSSVKIEFDQIILTETL